jgi:hypothetical protein
VESNGTAEGTTMVKDINPNDSGRSQCVSGNVFTIHLTGEANIVWQFVQNRLG